MLCNNLYDLSYLLSIPYDKLHLISPNIYNYLNSSIIEEIYFKKTFDFNWIKKFNYLIEKTQFKYKYKILDQNSKFIKVKFTLEKSFLLRFLSKGMTSACINEYILIIENLNNKLKIQFLVEKEQNPILYDSISCINLSNIEDLYSLNFRNFYSKGTNYIDSLYENFLIFTSDTKNKKRNYSFNISDACSYAEKFALTPNPDYKYFNGAEEGDCTNFASQIINAGGITTSKTWSPYTNPWIRVEDLYSYLISNNIGYKIPKNNPLSKGCLIQFYKPNIRKFGHTGFVTSELTNGDYLYCCHSYNKLNYPLSAVFPDIYPKIRCVQFY